MRPPVEREKLESLMAALGHRVTGPGRIFLTGGATALLYGWLLQLFVAIEPDLIRYPALDPGSFRAIVEQFCADQQQSG